MRAVIGVIVFISLLWAANARLEAVEEGGNKCEEMVPKKLIQMMEKEKDKIVVVDYRTPEDYYNNGHITGAILLSPNEKNFLQQRLDYYALQWKRNNKTAVIVDNDGRDANIFCRNMKLSTKFEHIYSLKGGMRLWILPLEKGKKQASDKKGKK